MSPFPRYRSKVLTNLMRQVNALRDRTQRMIRQAGVWGRWSLEVALYPLYRWEQVRKTLKRQLSQATESIKQIFSLSDTGPIKALSASHAIDDVLASIEILPASQPAQCLSESPSTAPIAQETDQKRHWYQRGLTHLKQLGHTLARWGNASDLAVSKQRHAEPRQASESAIILGVPTTPIAWVKGCITRVQHGTQALKRRLGLVQKSDAPLIQVGGLTNCPKIQGIATQLSNKHLVLITPDQEILDILTLPQQAILRQKINWALNRYVVRFFLHQARIRLTAGLQKISGISPRQLIASARPLLFRSFPLAKGSLSGKPSLPPASVMALPKISRWIFHSLIGAIASLPFVVIPALAAEPTPAPSAISSIKPQWVDPSHLKTRLSWEEIQGMVSKQTQSHGWLTQQSSTGALVEPLNEAQSSSLKTSFYTTDNSVEIPVQAEFMGYEPHLLEQVLGWLDRLLVVIETAIASLWQWTGICVIAFITALQKVKQLMMN